MEIQFRPAAAEDVAAALPLMYSAGPEAFEYGFTHGRRRVQDFLEVAFVDGRGLFGWRCHTVAMVDGAVAGIAAFYSGADYSRLSNETLRQALRFYAPWQLPVLMYRLLQLATVNPPPPRSALFVANFGVDPALRSRGVGAALLREQQRSAQRRGFRHYALDVSAQNPRGQALYERYGFRVIREQRFKGPAGKVPDSRRMLIDLG